MTFKLILQLLFITLSDDNYMLFSRDSQMACNTSNANLESCGKKFYYSVIFQKLVHNHGIEWIIIIKSIYTDVCTYTHMYTPKSMEWLLLL